MTQRQQLLAQQLLDGQLDHPVDNDAFVADETAVDAGHALALSLDIGETRMHCNHPGVEINGEAIDLFPRVTLRLANDNGYLVPLDRNLLRDPDGSGYWDISLSPGKIWSEPADGQWSRAALPFQLSNIFENDTHHGLATFLYNETTVSPIFFQIVTETKAFLCPENLQARGWLEARPVPLEPTATEQAIAAFTTELADQRVLRPLSDWRSTDTQSCLDDIENGFGSESTMVNGLVVDDEIFSSPCRTSMGDYPYPRAMKFGIWSATKTAFCSIACLRIAQISGQDPRTQTRGWGQFCLERYHYRRLSQHGDRHRYSGL